MWYKNRSIPVLYIMMRTALNSEISQCMQELKMLQTEGRSSMLTAAKKTRFSDYIFGVVERLGFIRMGYTQAMRVTEAFGNTIRQLNVLQDAVGMHTVTMATNPDFHATDVFEFIQKVITELGLITAANTSAEAVAMRDVAVGELRHLSQRIQGYEDTLRDRLEEARQARAHGHDSDGD
jgi:hypothetical protein